MGSDTRWWLMDGLGVVGADAVGGGGHGLKFVSSFLYVVVPC